MTDNQQETVDEIIEDAIPETKEEMRELLVKLSKELIDTVQKLKIVESELKTAVKRKKAKYDPRLKKVAMVMYSKPKNGGRVRMHTVDDVHGNLALITVKRMLTDPDNDFIGAYLLMPMKGYDDAYSRLNTNAEAAWHLFERLDADLKSQDPNKEEDEEAN
jgi:hypothetical protein